jgi:hypothetical protein
MAADGRAPVNSIFGLARSENGSCFPPAGLERIRCFYISREQAAAIRYIQEHTAENEPIFVGLNRHDRMFINNFLFYFVSKRPSRHKMASIRSQSANDHADSIGDARRTPNAPAAICSSELRVGRCRGTERKRPQQRVTLLAQYIRANYRAVASFGKIAILEPQ